MAADARVQDPRELARRVVPHHQAHVVTELLERCRLQLRVLDDRTPERPRERDDDPDLHAREPNDRLTKLGAMRLDGIHHVTCITGDAPRNVDFYTRVLGLRLVKKTVNQDDPTVYHLFYADEEGTPGSDITFFEYPGVAARPSRRRDGAHRPVARCLGRGARLLGGPARGRRPRQSRATSPALTFEDPEGLRHRLVVSTVDDAPLIAEHPDVPAEHALQGFDAVRAFAEEPATSRELLEDTLGFVGSDPTGLTPVWEARGPTRGGLYAYDEPPAERGVGGAGTVHHVAWSSSIEEHGPGTRASRQRG